jgi:hypothetical protein
MDNTIYEYIKNGITINGNPIDGYEVFTIPTQHFKMDSLHQLTPETFEREIQKQKEHDELTSEIFKEVQKEIDQEILNQLRGGEPNPDIIPMNTNDRLYKDYLVYVIDGVKNGFDRIKGYLDGCLVEFDGYYEHFTNPSFQYGFRPLTQEEFVNKLLTDDEFYQKWGEDCCEELTYEERYKLWFSNNYETGMEYNPVYTPPTEPDWDNEYYEPTPKRKLKWKH